MILAKRPRRYERNKGKRRVIIHRPVPFPLVGLGAEIIKSWHHKINGEGKIAVRNMRTGGIMQVRDTRAARIISVGNTRAVKLSFVFIII